MILRFDNMGWKSLILFFSVFIFLVNTAFSQPFGPPLFIANPETMECKYYFSGDQRHFNPRPENYTENIGYTTEFKDKDQACGMYICIKTNGRVLLSSKDDTNPRLCGCPIGTSWNNETGCNENNAPVTGLTSLEQEKKNFLIRLWEWIIALFK